MRLRRKIRSAVTGCHVDPDEAIIELRAAAEGVILGAGYPIKGRTQVNQADLDRLKVAIGFEPGQP